MPDYDIRALRTEDLASASETLGLAFASNRDYRPKLELQLRLAPGLGLVAAEGARVVGTGSLVPYGGAAYVGMVAVRPERQGRGLARAIMRRLLELARGRGYETVLLDASASGYPLYRSLGFEPVDEVLVTSRAAEGSRATPPAAAPTGSAPWSAATAAFDASIWGADRGAFLQTLASAPGNSVQAEAVAGGRLRGYLLVQADQAVLGPLLAEDERLALELLDRALAAAPGREWGLVLPAANGSFAAGAAARGFRELKRQTHMRLGPALAGRDRSRIFAQASLSLG